MSTWTKETKNASSFSNEANVNVVPSAKFDVGKFDKSKFDKPSTQDIQIYAQETKNASSFSKEAKN